MTTASRPSGSGSPVSTTTNAPLSRKTGVLSLAPTVSAARSAMPSIAEASNDGEDRCAPTGAAGTRPRGGARPRPPAGGGLEPHRVHALGAAGGLARGAPRGERRRRGDVVD